MKNQISNNRLNDLFESYIQTNRNEYFTEIVNSVQSWIKGIISNYIKDVDEQNDILQETLIRVEQNKNDFDSKKSNLKSWIYNRYLKGLILHNLRDKKKKNERMIPKNVILNDDEEIEFLETLPADIADPENNLIRLEKTFWLKKSIKQLDENQQDVVLLHHYGGKQLDEISALMKVEYATIRTWHYRALQKLQNELSKRIK